MIKVKGNTVFYINEDKIEEIKTNNPLEWIEDFYSKNQVKNLPKNIPFSGGLVGYFGYETIQFIEKKLDIEKIDALNVPDIFLFVCNEIIIFDNLDNCIQIIVNAKTDKENSYEESISRIEEVEKLINEKKTKNLKNNSLNKNDFTSSFKKRKLYGCCR